MRSKPSFKLGETPSKAQAERQSALQRIRWLADLFDDRFRLPGTERRFGLDGILGLIPGVGDTATGAVSLYLAAEAWRLGMPITTILRMLLNVGIDTVLGAVPLLGDLFDFAWNMARRSGWDTVPPSLSRAIASPLILMWRWIGVSLACASLTSLVLPSPPLTFAPNTQLRIPSQ